MIPGIQMLTFNFWKLEVGGWSPSAGRWALQIGCQIPKFNLPEVGSWNPISRRRLLESNLWKMEVGFELPEVGSSKFWTRQRKSGPPVSILFPRKNVRKNAKNSSFRGGKPPGRNARGNPWGPVRTRGGPRPILGLFSSAT